MKKIICPICGEEYYPQEIFILTQYADNKIRYKDITGKLIDDYDTKFEETYRCDACNNTFYIDMNIEFNCYVDEWEDEYSTKIEKPNLFMKEE